MDNNTDRNLVVDVKNLHISFKTFKGYSKVLNGVNLQVHKRERIAIVGETGCGKTQQLVQSLKYWLNRHESIKEKYFLTVKVF